ncbi:hypothetical protein Tco_1379734, partial [Tanacetum coccineum]
WNIQANKAVFGNKRFEAFKSGKRERFGVGGSSTPGLVSLFSIVDIAMGHVGRRGHLVLNKIINRVFQCALWAIWKWRNKGIASPAGTRHSPLIGIVGYLDLGLLLIGVVLLLFNRTEDKREDLYVSGDENEIRSKYVQVEVISPCEKEKEQNRNNGWHNDIHKPVYSGGSILQVMEDMVKVGKTMGYIMEGDSVESIYT